MINRSDWQAEPPSDTSVNQELPAKRVIIAHTATNHCESEDDCKPIVRTIQKFHMKTSHFSDIGYNFLIGGDGNSYEGRGWDFVGAHTAGHNTGSIGIAFIGLFDKTAPPENQLNAAKTLIQEGVRLGKLTKDYKLYGHRQFRNFNSPGDALYKIIQEWPNWTEKTEE